MRILKMYAHRIPRSLGGLFSDNESDPAPDATRYDDAVLIPGEPEARDIGSRDRIAVDFVVSHHDWSPLIASEAFARFASASKRESRSRQLHQRVRIRWKL